MGIIGAIFPRQRENLFFAFLICPYEKFKRLIPWWLEDRDMVWFRAPCKEFGVDIKQV